MLRRRVLLLLWLLSEQWTKRSQSGKSKQASPTTAQPGQIESTDWLRHGTFSEHKGDKERDEPADSRTWADAGDGDVWVKRPSRAQGHTRCVPVGQRSNERAAAAVIKDGVRACTFGEKRIEARARGTARKGSFARVYREIRPIE